MPEFDAEEVLIAVDTADDVTCTGERTCSIGRDPDFVAKLEDIFGLYPLGRVGVVIAARSAGSG